MSQDLAEYRRMALQRHLQKEIEGEVRFDAPARKLYATDASIYEIEPLGVVLPRHLNDLRAAVQISAEHHVPIVPRGGGTSLSGQAIGPGLVIDGSKYLNRILEIDPHRQRCRVQPGVILQQLNDATKPHGLMFGPDVSTANRATLGGMIGNNSAGAHSLVYGKTVDHVRAIQFMMADGTMLPLHELALANVNSLAKAGVPEALLCARIYDLIVGQAEEIDQRFPRILRRVSGYNLPEILAQVRKGIINLASLIVGSEGTLGFIAEAELALVPIPRHLGLLAPHFSSMDAALDAVMICLEEKPSAVELLDDLILNLARENLGLKRQMAAIQGRPAAVLLVEFLGDDPREVQAKIDGLAKRLRGQAGLIALSQTETDEQREALWRLREAGLPLLMGLPGDRKPVSFVEDAAVAPERLSEFARRFRALIASHGTNGSFYGHASVGCLHVRPILNLKDQQDIASMRKLSEEVVNLVLEFGGSLSGEHGDGLARSLWNERLFGSKIYTTFREIKKLFDPAGRLNPGKIVDGPPMTEQLRLGASYRTVDVQTVFERTPGEMAASVELCSGTGVCRKMKGGVMCPSYRATRDEEHSTRGRANALRWALKQPAGLDELRSDWLHEILDLCLSCKACKSECPSNVDIAQLKSEVNFLYYQNRRRPLHHLLLRNLPALLGWGAAFAPIVNALAQNQPVRWLIERIAGIDRRRSLPAFQRSHLRRQYEQRPKNQPVKRERIILLDDCFTTYQEPRIGIAAIELLESLGHRVELAGICCGRPLFSTGMLAEARQLAKRQLGNFVSRLDDNSVVLGIEPSCVAALVDEWPRLFSDSSSKKLASRTFLLDEWLERQLASGEESLSLRPLSARAVLHGHCHQRALFGLTATASLIRRLSGVELTVLDDGCCGMAGFFGYEKLHYELSMSIAELSFAEILRENPNHLVLATGTSCRHQIKDVSGRRALHPIELIAAQVVAATP